MPGCGFGLTFIVSDMSRRTGLVIVVLTNFTVGYANHKNLLNEEQKKINKYLPRKYAAKPPPIIIKATALSRI